MAVIARDQITLSWQLDVVNTIYYYKKQSSTAAVPAKPTAYPPSGWTTTEPAYSSGETSTLYVTVCTIYSDNTYEYSDVSVSASFEAAKAAYNKAVSAEGVANNAITAANGKNKIFYQDAAPASGMSEGDLWFDTDGGNAVYEYKKTSSSPETYEWTLRQFGSGSIAAGSITANEINVANLSSITANLGSAVIGGVGNANGILTVKDASGATIGTWNKDGIWTIAGTIGPLTITTDGLHSGQLSIGNTTYTSGTSTVTKTILGVSSAENGEGGNVTIDADGLFSRSRIALAGSGGTTYYSNFPSASIQTTDYEDTGGNTWKQGVLTLRTQRSVNGLSLLNRAVTLELTPTGSSTNASHVLDIVGGSSYVSGVRIRPSSSNDTASLIIQGHTEGGSLLYGSNNPAIYFQNAEATQNLALIFTDYDSVQAPASLTLAGNQGGEYFIAPNLKATNALYVGSAKFLGTQSQTLTVNSSYVSAGSIKVMRKGVMVNLHGAGVTTSASATSSINLLSAVLPADYRPRVEAYFASSTGNQHFKITTSGLLSFVATTAPTSGMYFDVTYMANS